MSEFGKLLHENWLLKRSLSKKVSNARIDAIYEKALKSAMTKDLFVTDHVYEMVKSGKNFRDAYMEVKKNIL